MGTVLRDERARRTLWLEATPRRRDCSACRNTVIGMFSIRKFLAAFSVTHGLLSSVYGQLVPGELVVTERPTPAPAIAETITVAKPVISIARFPRVNNEATAPITLAPDPDYPEHPGEAAFRQRWADPQRKSYTAARAAAPAPVPLIRQRTTLAASPPVKPIDKAVMVRQVQCVGGTCQTAWVPASSVLTATVQPQRVYQRQRFRLFQRRR